MNTYNFYDSRFQETNSYKKYIENNPKTGLLKIHAFAASEAIPIKGMKITISKEIDNYNVIFFEGYTNESGVINNIVLPAPAQNTNDLTVPLKATYKIESLYNNKNALYIVNIYDGLYVIQDINVVLGDMSGY